MISYIGRHAELYDIMYDTKPYKEEAEFISEYFRTHNAQGNSIIELACGTGNHAFEFEKLRYSITAFDNSEDMIRQAVEKKEKRKSTVDFRLDSMMECKTIQHNLYDFGVCLFDSLGYVLTTDNIMITLRNVYERLHKNGIFCCEVWHSVAMMKYFSPTRKKEWVLPDRTIIRFSETDLTVKDSTATIDFTILELMNDGTFLKLNEKQKNRYFNCQEITFLLQSAGFSEITIFNGYTGNRTISDDTWHLLCFGHKK